MRDLADGIRADARRLVSEALAEIGSELRRSFARHLLGVGAKTPTPPARRRRVAGARHADTELASGPAVHDMQVEERPAVLPKMDAGDDRRECVERTVDGEGKDDVTDHGDALLDVATDACGHGAVDAEQTLDDLVHGEAADARPLVEEVPDPEGDSAEELRVGRVEILVGRVVGHAAYDAPLLVPSSTVIRGPHGDRAIRCGHCYQVGHAKIDCPDLSAADVLADLTRRPTDVTHVPGSNPNDRPTSTMDPRREQLAKSVDGDRVLRQDALRSRGAVDHDTMDWVARERLRLSVMPQLAPRTERVCRDNFPSCLSCPLDPVCRVPAAPGVETARWVEAMDLTAAKVEVDE